MQRGEKLKTPKLFISYRRDGGEALAFLLYDRLTKKGYSVFYDIESLHAGKFDQKIFTEIEDCDHFILVLSVGALDRCVNENDWIRWEITHALEHKKNIVPVMMRGFMFPENLPEEIAEISSINGVLFESMSLMDARIEQLITFFSPVESTAVSQNPILERAFMALEDGEWKQADDFCEQVLNTDPRNVQAYLFKLMAELCVYKKEDLAKLEKPFDDSPHYSKIMRFGDLDSKNEIRGYIQEIRLRNLYISSLTAMENARTESDCRKAAQSFSELGSYKDAKYLREKCLEKAEIARKNAIYNTALNIEKNAKTEEDFQKAEKLFEEISSYKDSEAFLTKIRKQIKQIKEERLEQKRVFIKKVQQYISAGWDTVGLKWDGTLAGVGIPSWELRKWRDIVAVSACGFRIVCLKSDGSVAEFHANDFVRCDVSKWRNIAAVSAGWYHTVGLKSDGTVVAVGSNGYGVCDVSEWRDIVAVSAGWYHIVGLKSDGTVVAVGNNGGGKCDVSEWRDIVAVSAGYNHTIGLKTDGTVVAVGDNGGGECDVSEWRDIVAVSAGYDHTVGLKSDGTVVAVGNNGGGKCEVSGLRDIVAISAGILHTAGLKSDGTVVEVGENMKGDSRRVLDWKLFKNNNLRQERNVCQHCGGSFKGIFTKKCARCGKPKDY